MKYTLGILLLIIMALPLAAQNPNITASFTPSVISVNSFQTSSFDPETPWTQPIMTSLLINNISDSSFRFYMKVEIYWSGLSSPLVEATYISANMLAAGNQFYPLTNQDVITNQASGYFNRVGEINFSLQDIVNRSSILKSAVMSGYFPDGAILIKVSVQPESDGYFNWNGASSTTFTINVQTAGDIYLISPGVPMGTNPPQIGENPLTFLWNTLDTGFNGYRLTIREYPQNDPPTYATVDNAGHIFYNGVIGSESFSFSEYLPFNPGNYYAWRVSTRRYTELDPSVPDLGRDEYSESMIVSNWKVFQFVLNEEPNDTVQRIEALLNSTKDPQIRELLNTGFLPSGEVMWNGRSYTGQAAIDLLESLKDKELTIRIWE